MGLFHPLDIGSSANSCDVCVCVCVEGRGIGGRVCEKVWCGGSQSR